MRVTKDQVQAALKLFGLEFQDAELDMMLRNVNRALYNYEALRKIDVPYGTEPAFAFHPGLAGPQTGARAAAVRHHHPAHASRASEESGGPGVPAGDGTRAAGALRARFRPPNSRRCTWSG